MALSRIFDIAQRSLGTYQRALDVTSHNIANASNPNYSRQRANFATEIPEINAGMIWGSGVRLENIGRVRNQLTESQILNNNPKFSFNDKSSYLLGQIENVFSEPSELGLSTLIDDFMNSWSQLSTSPNSIPLRNNVIYAAQKMGAKVDNLNESFDIIKSDIVAEFKSTITQINDYVDQIKNLNSKIFESSGSGISPNDFLDERDRLINELSKLTNINVTYDDKNIATISIGGVFAADGTSSVEFEAFEKNGELLLRSKNSMNLAALTGGEMYALKDVYSNKIPNYQSQLHDVVRAIRDEVNQIHESGYTIDDPPLSGIKFFDESDEGRLVVNSTILNDPYKIAVSSDGSTGNGDLALAIHEISDKKLINNLSISEAYSTLISGIGNNKQSNDNMAATDKLVLDQLELQKASYSGVSIDEEMSNVIKFQRSYDASAKLIRVADELLETLINMV
jgi:flagellar hook-associated protein 1 FlgK